MIKYLFYIVFSSCLLGSQVKTFSLQEAEELALTRNEQIQEMDHLVEKARYGHLVAISDWLPKLELISQAFQTQHDQIGGSNRKSSFLTQLQLSQTLFSADKYYDLKITRLIQEELQWIKLGMVNDVLYDVRRIYFKIILDKNQIETAKVHIDVLKALALRMEKRLEIGTATTFDVNQLQVAVSNLLSVYYKATKQLKVDLDTFAKLLGYDPGSIALEVEEESIPLGAIPFLRKKLAGQEEAFLKEQGSASLIFLPTNPARQERWLDTLFTKEEMSDWEEVALRFRPDLVRQEKAWDVARAQVKKARGDYFPTLEFGASYGGEPTPFDEYPRSSFGNQDFQWGLGVTLRWNLFDSLKRERKILASQAEARAEKSSLNAQKQEALKEVRDDLFSIAHSMATYVSAKGTIKLAKQALEQAEEKLEIGYLSIFDYQIAVNHYIEALHLFFTSQYELIDSYYLLRHATGIDVEKKENVYER
ncbi:MAG: TolC family protein [Chlamydiia bacterium]|nr:TolC family protein [Chlamydiia bacterium]